MRLNNNYLSQFIVAGRSGQVIIAILGVMAFSLVVGLAVSSRVVTALRQVSYSTQSAEALAFAEAGAEHALKCLADGTCSAGASGSLNIDGAGGNDVDYRISNFDAGAAYVDAFSPLKPGEMVQINLDGYPVNTPVYIHWIMPSWDEFCNQMALEANLVYSDGSGRSYSQRGAWDPWVFWGGLPGYTRFDTPSFSWQQIGGITYIYRVELRPPAGVSPKILRLRFLRGGSLCGGSYGGDVTNHIAVSAPAGATFPLQGLRIESVGYSGKVRRKVQVTRMSPSLPETFDFVYFSGESSF